MKKQWIMPIVLLFLGMTGCQEAAPLPENSIILIERSTNGAWGHYDSGYFVDSAGDVYDYDFSSEIGGCFRSGALFLDQLYALRELTEPLCSIDETTVQKLWKQSRRITEDMPFPCAETAMDAGEKSVYIVQDSGEMILVRETGDETGRRTGIPAASLLWITDNTVSPAARAAYGKDGYRPTYYYTDFHIEHRSIGAHPELAGRYVLPDAEAVEAFTRDTGITLESEEWCGVFPSDWFSYLIEVIPADADVPRNAVLIYDGGIMLTEDPDADPPEESDGFILYAAEVPKFGLYELAQEDGSLPGSGETAAWMPWSFVPDQE